MERREIFETYQERQYVEKGFKTFCFDATIIKSLTVIFTKLIILCEFNENKPNKPFAYYNELVEFINKYVMEFILNYNVRLDVGFIREFNTCLSSLDNFSEREDDNEGGSESFSRYTLGTSYRPHIDHTEDIINIQNFEKIISNNQEDYAVPFLFDCNSVFNYSANYFVNLKELYTMMNTKNYNIRSIFDKFLDQFVAYNLELSLFDAKTQTMHSVQYLLGFVNSIGLGNSFMSTKLFTGKETFDLISMSNYNKNFAESLSLSNNKDPKFNFNLISETPNQGMNIQEFGKFVDSSLNKYLKIDIFNFTTGDYLSDQMRDDSNTVIFN